MVFIKFLQSLGDDDYLLLNKVTILGNELYQSTLLCVLLLFIYVVVTSIVYGISMKGQEQFHSNDNSALLYYYNITKVDAYYKLCIAELFLGFPMLIDICLDIISMRWIHRSTYIESYHLVERVLVLSALMCPFVYGAMSYIFDFISYDSNARALGYLWSFQNVLAVLGLAVQACKVNIKILNYYTAMSCAIACIIAECLLLPTFNTSISASQRSTNETGSVILSSIGSFGYVVLVFISSLFYYQKGTIAIFINLFASIFATGFTRFMVKNIAVGVMTILITALPLRISQYESDFYHTSNSHALNEVAEIKVLKDDNEKEKENNYDLLTQLLPVSIVQDLKINKTVIPKEYESVTLCFCDIVGFTDIAHSVKPGTLLPTYKVETVGDSYFIASGLPELDIHHCNHIANFALIVLDLVKLIKSPLNGGSESISLRVGIHEGSVMAAVIGSKPYRYCIFGDCVNVSSRMEATGVVNKIQLSESAATMLSKTNEYIIEERGFVEVKGKGQMKTYFLVGPTASNKFINQAKLATIRRTAVTLLASMDTNDSIEKLCMLASSTANIGDHTSDKVVYVKDEFVRRKLWTEGLTAVVVEDNVVCRKILKAKLIAAGHDVVSFSSGNRCLDVLAGTGSRSGSISSSMSSGSSLIGLPDMILIDYHLPGMNGADVARMIEKFMYDVPLVVCMSDDSAAISSVKSTKQSQYILPKPIDISSLESMYNKAIQPV